MNDSGPEPGSGTDHRLRRRLGQLVSLAVVALIFARILPELADYEAVIEGIQSLGRGQVVVLLLLTVATIVPYASAYSSGLRDLSFIRALEMHLASTAVSNTVPVGGAVALGVQARMFSSWGLSAPNMAAGMLVVGLGDNALKVLTALAGAAAAAVDGELPLWVKTVLAVSVAVAVLGGGLLVGGLRTDEAARRVGAWIDSLIRRFEFLAKRSKGGFGQGLQDLRARILAMAEGRIWWLLGSLTVAHVATYLLLFASLRFVGVSGSEVDWATVLFAHGIVRIAIAVPITPGGVGVAELGLVSLLAVGATDATAALITSGVLIFRLLTYLAPIPLGGVAYLLWRLTTPDIVTSTDK